MNSSRSGSPHAEDASDAWYLSEGKRGQLLMDQGQLERAMEVFETILARLGDAPSYGRAVILERLGRCSHFRGSSDLAVAQFREGIAVTERLTPSDGVKQLRGVLHSDLGDTFRVTGNYAKAREAYEAALKTAEELKDPRGQGIDLGHLGALALAEGKLAEALECYRQALKLLQPIGEPTMEAVVWHQLGRVLQEMRQANQAEEHYLKAARILEQQGNLAGTVQTYSQLAILSQASGKLEAAEAWYRRAIDIDRKTGDRLQLRRHLSSLAGLLEDQPVRIAEARELAIEALSVAHTLDPTLPEIWATYGVLANIAGKEAATTTDSERRAALESRARDYRQIEQYAPRFLATLARLGDTPSYSRAVLLERLGRCLQLGGRPDLAIVRLCEAMGAIEKLTAPDDGVEGFCGTLHSELGDALRATGQHAKAREAYEAALEIAEKRSDLRGAATALRQLARLAQELGQWDEAERRRREAARIEEGSAGETTRTPIESRVATSFDVTLYEDRSIDYVFDPDLLVDGRRERRMFRWTGEPSPLAGNVCPMLAPCARSCTDDEGAVRFYLLPGEPIIEQHPGCTAIRRVLREVRISGNSGILWRMIREMDGARTVAEICFSLPASERPTAARMLAALAATGVSDVSGRAIGRFLHSLTKKGVVPGGGLESGEVLQLATDGNYRTYPDAPRIALGQSVPDGLRGFHALTRSRRSRRDFLGYAIGREAFDALLSTACGATGAMLWAGREVKLRAYPASGALYAVEIYPVVFAVEDLQPAVYHYRAVENELEVVRADIDRARFVAAALPAEREMLSGASAMICLAGFFPRHEKKYGQGGYRMLVAEAGHISQNLILAATALGLSARPFGGVFDALLNHALGLDGDEEQFLLAVLVGYSAERR
jgi:SagB-type dehydrogenase family enzyme